MKKYIILILSMILSSWLYAANRVKVACIGNSVTFGYGITDNLRTYPAQLQNMLGGEYDVQNFGHNGATLLKQGHNPYWKVSELEKALKFRPDIVIIHLGLNDTDPRNWPKFGDDFTRDYTELIHVFQQTNPAVNIYICKLTPIFTGHPRFKSSTRIWYEQIQNEISRIASVSKVQLIDLNTPLKNRSDLFLDNLHPIAEGAEVIARTIYRTITGRYDGLKLNPIFTNNMVIQREKPIRFWGTADADSKIRVSFAGVNRETKASKNGNWVIEFPAMKADRKPYQAVIECGKQAVKVSNILLGDVWICSGQSNMAFELINTTFAKQDIPKSENKQLRFFNMREIALTQPFAWDSLTLKKVNQLSYYRATVWQKSDSSSSKEFSAVGYYFGKILQEKLNIPIGLINNAIGGSPAEAWIDRATLENDPLLVNLFDNWENSDFIDSWVRKRAKENIKNASEPKFQQHPYKPSYLYTTAIQPYEAFPIAGVIWYQGESNAGNIELYEKIFPALVKSWRKGRGYDFPFYYVQLSSMKTGRETWGHFRDSQRRLLKIVPNTGMAVCSDVGDSVDVHPRNKKPVSERLANWALADYYNLPVTKSGPLFKKVIYKSNKAVISFSEAKKLKTVDGKSLVSFELAGEDKIFYPAKALIRGVQILVESSKVTKPAFVRYGWQSFTEGNLINEAELPASTFSTEFQK